MIMVILGLEDSQTEKRKIDQWKKEPYRECLLVTVTEAEISVNSALTKADVSIEERMANKVKRMKNILQESAEPNVYQPGGVRKQSVVIFSRAKKSDYSWLKMLLESPNFSNQVQSVRSHYITDNNLDKLNSEFVSECTFGILFHTKNKEDINVHDVMDSLYVKERDVLSSKLGKKNLIIVIDDVTDSSDHQKIQVLEHQPSIREQVQEIFLISPEEKTSNYQRRLMVIREQLKMKLQTMTEMMKERKTGEFVGRWKKASGEGGKAGNDKPADNIVIVENSTGENERTSNVSREVVELGPEQDRQNIKESAVRDLPAGAPTNGKLQDEKTNQGTDPVSQEVGNSGTSEDENSKGKENVQNDTVQSDRPVSDDYQKEEKPKKKKIGEENNKGTDQVPQGKNDGVTSASTEVIVESDIDKDKKSKGGENAQNDTKESDRPDDGQKAVKLKGEENKNGADQVPQGHKFDNSDGSFLSLFGRVKKPGIKGDKELKDRVNRNSSPLFDRWGKTDVPKGKGKTSGRKNYLSLKRSKDKTFLSAFCKIKPCFLENSKKTFLDIGHKQNSESLHIGTKSIGIFSRSSEREYSWLTTLLESEDFRNHVQTVQSYYISNEGSQFYNGVSQCKFGILYHTKKRGRINVTDVTDSLYDEELEYLSSVLGKKNVVVIIDDVDDTSDEMKKKFLTAQHSIARLAQDLIFVKHLSAEEKMKQMEDAVKKVLL
ncbi:uncharacterized protein RB166_016079 [Leptodactylus fuscus]|uniref:uncharacterized protein LOC142217205 n=1 Tax=Leptodactylus fuscus TaxID=238119 RepID=UPI003F4EF393